MPRSSLILIAVLCAAIGPCRGRELRGWDEATPDGGSMLAIDDDCGGGPVWVDGKRWKAPRAVPLPVKPGTHTVSCGDKPDPNTEEEAHVKPGRAFHFDYWGP